MSADTLTEALTSRLSPPVARNTSAGAVYSLTGPWGSGKSFLWNHRIAPKLGGTPHVTVSLFGIDTLELLSRRIVSASLAIGLHDTDKASLMKRARELAGPFLRSAISSAIRATGLEGISLQVDPLEFIQPGLVICLDDIERAGPELTYERILGAANYLAEYKNARVLLIMNRDAWEERYESDKDLSKHAERVISREFRLSTRLEQVFDTLLNAQGLRDDAADSIKAHKDTIIKILKRAECSNLRTLQRTMLALGELHDIEPASVSETRAAALAAMVSERDAGIKRNRQFYAFDEAQIMFGSLRDDQTHFHKRLFLGTPSYRFFHSSWRYLENGFFSSEEVRSELPRTSERTRTEFLVSQINSMEVLYFGDRKHEAFRRSIIETIEGEDPMEIKDLLQLLPHAERGPGTQTTELPRKTLQRVRERMRSAAIAGDDTHITSHMRLRGLTDKWFQEYDTLWNDARTGCVRMELDEAIRSRNIEKVRDTLAREPQLSFDMLRVAPSLVPSEDSERRFFHESLQVAVHYAVGMTPHGDHSTVESALVNISARMSDARDKMHVDRLIRETRGDRDD